MVIDIVKIFLPTVVSFVIGVALTPPLTDFLYKHKLWKKKSGKVDMAGNDTPIFNSLHKETQVNTPRMGGVVVWGSALLTCLGIWVLAKFVGTDTFVNLDFLSRNQTWLQFTTLIF